MAHPLLTYHRIHPRPHRRKTNCMHAIGVDFFQPRTQGPLSSSLEKVPWFRLVTWHPKNLGANKTTSYPGSSLFLPRESTLVSAGHVAPKIWVLTRMCYKGGVAKCNIVTSVRMVESTGGDVSFFRNICGDKELLL